MKKSLSFHNFFALCKGNAVSSIIPVSWTGKRDRGTREEVERKPRRKDALCSPFGFLWFCFILSFAGTSGPNGFIFLLLLPLLRYIGFGLFFINYCLFWWPKFRCQLLAAAANLKFYTLRSNFSISVSLPFTWHALAQNRCKVR